MTDLDFQWNDLLKLKTTMSAQSLFNIILKIFGIYFIREIIFSIPALLSVLYSFGVGDISGAISTLLISLLTLLVYVGVAYTFLFKSDMLIRRLRLMENFPEHTIPLNIHRSTVISIAIMIVALLLITQAIPLLIRGLTKWYQYNRLARGIFRETETFDYSIVLMYVGQIVIGFLLIGYHRQFANYIELQSRRKNR